MSITQQWNRFEHKSQHQAQLSYEFRDCLSVFLILLTLIRFQAWASIEAGLHRALASYITNRFKRTQKSRWDPGFRLVKE